MADAPKEKRRFNIGYTGHGVTVARRAGEHQIQVNPGDVFGIERGQPGSHCRAPVATLGEVSRVSQGYH